MIERQHVWLGPDATTFEEPCEACLAVRDPQDDEWSVSVEACFVHGTLRKDADVGFTTCRRGHRIVMHRVARQLARAV